VIAGNTIDDLWGTSIECGTTYPDGKGGPNGDCNVALPAFEISFKVVKAFRIIADVFVDMQLQLQQGQHEKQLDQQGQQQWQGQYNLTAEAESMRAEAYAILKDTAVAAQRSAVPAEGILIGGRNISCYPCHAGWSSCKTGFKHPGFIRPSADIMCHTMRDPPASAAEVWPPQLLDDVKAYSRAFGGGGAASAPSENDEIRKELFDVFDTGLNTMTRGTWTGAEDRNW
jgi:hypothetical protein